MVGLVGTGFVFAALVAVPLWLGNVLMIGGTLIGLALVARAYYLEGTGAGLIFLAGFGIVLVTTHGLGHLAVGSLIGGPKGRKLTDMVYAYFPRLALSLLEKRRFNVVLTSLDMEERDEMPEQVTRMENQIKAVIQQYNNRMIDDRLVPNGGYSNLE